jgi:hypothetical protein
MTKDGSWDISLAQDCALAIKWPMSGGSLCRVLLEDGDRVPGIVAAVEFVALAVIREPSEARLMSPSINQRPRPAVRAAAGPC